jgi:hypothetical protein
MSYRSKTLAAWLAVGAGPMGAHRFYMHGWRDLGAWLHVAATLLGAAGVIRMRNLGQDDVTSWALIPWLGLSVAAAMLGALIWGLMPDERWNARFNGDAPDGRTHETGWLTILAVIAALLVGATVLMATLAFGFQKLFEYQALP